MKYGVLLFCLFCVNSAFAGDTPVQKEISPVQKSVSPVQKEMSVMHSPVQKSAVQKSHHCKCCICVLEMKLACLMERPLCNFGKICAVKKTLRILRRQQCVTCYCH